MMYYIYHAKPHNFFVESLSKSNYMEVGIVEAQSFDDAYAKTQNIFNNWTKEKCVLSSAGECRSTSPGDVIMDFFGRTMIVENIGFSEINEDFTRKV